MKKLIMLVTMLLVPALASAWTLPVKVINNTAGITAGNKATVTIGVTPTDVNVGTRYFYPTAAVVTVPIAIPVANLANIDYVTVDGGAVTPDPVTGVFNVAKPAGTLRSVVVAFKTTASVTYAPVTVTQTANGLTTLKVGSSSSVSGWSSVAVGTAVTVVPAPNSNATIGGVTVNAAPLAAPYIFTVAAGANAVSATYTLKPVVTATLTAPTSGNAGSSVTASVATNGLPGQAIQWTVNGVAAGTAPTQAVPLNLGQNTVSVTVSATDAAPVTKAQYIQGVDALSAAIYACTSCHSGSTPAIVTAYRASGHADASYSPTCQACHSDSPHGVGINSTNISSSTFTVLSSAVSVTEEGVTTVISKGGIFCTGCHKGEYAIPHVTTGLMVTCNGCHTPGGTGDVHAVAALSCVNCHALAVNAGVNNDGVRAIVGEFGKRSHHVTGRSVKDSDCATCHMEGKKNGTKVSIDETYHMVDGRIYLRNGNVGLISASPSFAWDPENPNHTTMDNFCMSCHNDAGAPTAAAALAGVTGYTGTALNPFGDTVSNSYDQVSRVNVVGVYQQFDTNNSSHHAVRGAKYGVSTLVGNAAVFSQISSANYQYITMGSNKPIKGVKSLIGTMKDKNYFTATYTTLDGGALADNVTIHCGDCHTVGQFRAADVGVAPFNNAVIGAHGSENEYMLRNSNGDDTLAKDALVCYICHTYAQYGDAASGHNGVASSALHCNADTYNAAGLAAAARLLPEEGLMDDATFQTEVADGTYAPTGGGNIFGIKCLSCHNSSDKKTFGGIHGNAGNATFTTYSGQKSSTSVQLSTPISRKPYRFMPGLGNFRFNGGDAPDSNNGASWTVKTLSTANKQGCYTLNGDMTRISLTAAKNAGTNVNASTAGVPDDDGILGSWGACTDHAGTSYQGGREVSRTILRPLTY